MSYLKPRRSNQTNSSSANSSSNPYSRPANKDIIIHEKKRQVEIKCIQLREMLLNKGTMEKDDVDLKVDELRKELLADLDKLEARKAKE